MLKEVVAILLLSFVCVRSDWLFTQPCDKDGVIANYGTYTDGLCSHEFGYSSYGVCNGWQTWQIWTCKASADCGDPSCRQTDEMPMGKCQNGLYHTCTDKDNFNINNMEWPAVSFGMYGSGCTTSPVQAYVAEMSACINYNPQHSNYQSYKVDCLKNGAQAKISYFQNADCASLAKTVVMGTNNCTVVPDFFYYTPIMVQCSDLD